MEKFLAGHICLVTGGAQGIGWAVAQAMADYGAQVYVCDISEKLPCADQITLSHCDVAQRDEVKSWISEIYERHGRIDILVNNAAFVRWTGINEMTVEEAELTMQVGYNAMVYTTKAVLPLMQAAGQGHIVNMGSSAGILFIPGPSAAYAATKAAINAYSRILQIELQDSSIYVTLVLPASVAGTNFFRKHVPSSKMPRMADFFPYLTPDQVAKEIIKAIKKKRHITLNIPGFMSLLYVFSAIAPNFLRRLLFIGGRMHGDYGEAYKSDK